VALDRARVLAQQIGCDEVVDMGLDRAGTEIALAEADRPLVAVDLDPDQVRKLLQADEIGRASCRERV
jgi:hypothetical protein